MNNSGSNVETPSNDSPSARWRDRVLAPRMAASRAAADEHNLKFPIEDPEERAILRRIRRGRIRQLG